MQIRYIRQEWKIVLVISMLALLICSGMKYIREGVSAGMTNTEAWQEYCFVQYDPAWAEQKLGDSDYTLASSGCLTACIASVLAIQEIQIEEKQEWDPGKLNRILSDHQVYDGKGNIQWGPLEQTLEVQVVRKDMGEIRQGELRKVLEQGNYPIVRVKSRKTGHFHFVLIVLYENREYWCIDPMNAAKTLISLSEYQNKIYAVRYLTLPSSTL